MMRCCRRHLTGVLILVITLAHAHAAYAQTKPAGPPDGLAVQVVNTPLPVTGTVEVVNSAPLPVTGTVNVVAHGPQLFFQSSAPTCDVLNRCFVKFPAVPAGKQLKVTRIHGALYFSNVEAFVALDLNNLNSQVFVEPVHPFAAAYLSTTLSFNEATEVVFQAGQIPIVEMGTAGTFTQSGFNRLGITGEFSDVAP